MPDGADKFKLWWPTVECNDLKLYFASPNVAVAFLLTDTPYIVTTTLIFVVNMAITGMYYFARPYSPEWLYVKEGDVAVLECKWRHMALKSR